MIIVDSSSCVCCVFSLCHLVVWNICPVEGGVVWLIDVDTEQRGLFQLEKYQLTHFHIISLIFTTLNTGTGKLIAEQSHLDFFILCVEFTFNCMIHQTCLFLYVQSRPTESSDRWWNNRNWNRIDHLLWVLFSGSTMRQLLWPGMWYILFSSFTNKQVNGLELILASAAFAKTKTNPSKKAKMFGLGKWTIWYILKEREHTAEFRNIKRLENHGKELWWIIEEFFTWWRKQQLTRSRTSSRRSVHLCQCQQSTEDFTRVNTQGWKHDAKTGRSD